MEDVAVKDQERKKAGNPALGKLKMLGEVMEVLQKWAKLAIGTRLLSLTPPL